MLYVTYFFSRILSSVINNCPIELLSASLNPGFRKTILGQITCHMFAANGRTVEQDSPDTF